MKGMRGFLLFIGLILATSLYLWPGSQALFEGRTDTVMSDDTDPAPLPYMYDQMIHQFHEHPSSILYGAIYMPNLDPMQGQASWIPWNERLTVLLTSAFVPFEQQSTMIVMIIMIINAIAMYLLARFMSWNSSLASGVALAWTFCCFTLARAKVHMGFAGTYHLPLIFLSLLLIVRLRSRASLFAAMGAFLVAATVAHYYLVTTAFLAPVFLAFVILQPEFKTQWKTILVRLTFAALPAVLLLGFQFAKPLSSDVKLPPAAAYPATGKYMDNQLHPYLTLFAARPVDYIAGDIALGPVTDWNPLRAEVSHHILTHLDGSNPHERSNGIRWSLLALMIAALAMLATRFKDFAHTERRWLLYFTAFTVFGFLLSLAPDAFVGVPWGPSWWLNSVVSQIRVPSRAGILVNFGILMIAGALLNSRLWNSKKWRAALLLPAVFPLIVLLERPPMMPGEVMSEIRPRISSLGRENGLCGAGFYFPFVSPYMQVEAYYGFLQRMRGSDCQILNSSTAAKTVQTMTELFPPTAEYEQKVISQPQVMDQLTKLVRCVPLTWLIFDRGLPAAWTMQACRALGWQLHDDLSCTAPDRGPRMAKMPEQCL